MFLYTSSLDTLYSPTANEIKEPLIGQLIRVAHQVNTGKTLNNFHPLLFFAVSSYLLFLGLTSGQV
jgi:hypothetical protein